MKVIKENCDPKDAQDKSLPYTAYLVEYKVDGKEYDIRFDPSRLEWSCDCKAYQFRRRHKIKYCKHIMEIQEQKMAERIGRAGARVV